MTQYTVKITYMPSTRYQDDILVIKADSPALIKEVARDKIVGWKQCYIWSTEVINERPA